MQMSCMSKATTEHREPKDSKDSSTTEIQQKEVAKMCIREAVIEEIVSLFHSFSLRLLAVLVSVSDIAAKEEQMLQWAETDSLQTAVQRRMYIILKYMEMLLRKFLEARCRNFVFGMPTSAIDLKVLDLLSDAHRIALEKLMEELKINKLEWTRPSSFDFFGTDI
ncbi:hypothetical protein F511_32920 [Dorcoceras hygrometricum]|uniref:Uncharacterized protein n=1 Tax=Dorcoceras hygrometricum TaxID=472368 RepID=A0A2Z7BTE6_9LAMI|nr:hypothetical protein F511_32920 [Dorcoceras hygrometricum]